VDGQVIVKIKQHADADVVAARHNMTNLADIKDRTYLFGNLGARTVEQAIDELKRDRDVNKAEPNYVLILPEVDQRNVAYIDGGPASYYGQYAVSLIRATLAQAITSGSGVTVAVIDTGLDSTHPAFAGHLVQGWDYVGNDANPAEEGTGGGYGHGTMLAGLVILVAPGAMIMPLRVFDPTGAGDVANVSSAIRYAADHGARVINMSFGMSDISDPLQSAITYAWQRGAILIASAGNANTSAPHYPAAFDEQVLAVTATDPNDVKAGFSSYGSYVDVSAPGVSVYSTYPGGQYAWWDGTSFAAPLASGEAALVLSSGRGADRITSRVVDITPLNPNYLGQLGSGRIDCLAAVSP